MKPERTLRTIRLSAWGLQRHAEILELAAQTLAERARTSRSRRSIGSAIALALVAITLLAQPWTRSVRRERVDTVPESVARRWPTSESLGYRFSLIDDAELERQLRAIGTSASVVQIDDDVRIVTPDGSELAMSAHGAPATIRPAS